MAEQAAQNDHPVEEKIIEMEIERLRDFRNHPFHVKDDAEMEDLKNSIRRFGILSPIIVRPMQDGTYEIISGHRRKHAAKALGYRKVPVIIRALEDDDAVISMVDSNLHREWMQERGPDPGSEEYRGQVRALTELCRARNINPILRQGNLDQSVLFSILVEAIYRTMILVRSYAPDGELIAPVLKETYCSGKDWSEVQLYRALNISRATYYRRKQKGIQYAGYFFYEAVLPDLEGLI